jgi:hypothetical protein
LGITVKAVKISVVLLKILEPSHILACGESDDLFGGLLDGQIIVVSDLS